MSAHPLQTNTENYCVAECNGCVFCIKIIWSKGNFFCARFSRPDAEWNIYPPCTMYEHVLIN